MGTFFALTAITEIRGSGSDGEILCSKTLKQQHADRWPYSLQTLA
jgi:hypothetical protein